VDNESISINKILDIIENLTNQEILSIIVSVILSTETKQDIESVLISPNISLIEQKEDVESTLIHKMFEMFDELTDEEIINVSKIMNAVNILEDFSYQELLSVLKMLNIDETIVFTEDVLTKFKEFLIKAFVRRITKYPQILLPNVRADISSISMPTLLFSTPYNENLPYNDSNDGYNGLYEYHKLQSDTVIKSQKIRPFVKTQKVSYN